MIDQSIMSLISETCTALNDLKARDAHAEAYERAQERIVFLLHAVQRLHAALQRLRAASLLLNAAVPNDNLALHWTRTCADVRREMPRDFRAPATAIIEGHLDLLRLIEYTARSAAVAEERGNQIVEHLAQWMPTNGSHEGAREMHRSWIEEALGNLVQQKSANAARDSWQALLRRCGGAP